MKRKVRLMMEERRLEMLCRFEQLCFEIQWWWLLLVLHRLIRGLCRLSKDVLF